MRSNRTANLLNTAAAFSDVAGKGVTTSVNPCFMILPKKVSYNRGYPWRTLNPVYHSRSNQCSGDPNHVSTQTISVSKPNACTARAMQTADRPFHDPTSQ